ncbi:exported protein (hyp2) [Plasmodium reichenowi]|uniref:Exported protein (Hyp2) n=1 Tax=Plasmodium reichenowi TaxID=5854 RepID=A0A151LEU9_PLARE|nr:exported protein (hyp2) [Plasmodium reichenowi]KYN97468.1 exported protein (hyp2) [Plasmodium reichenowi]
MTNLSYGNTFNFIRNKYDEVIQHGCINLDNMHKNNKKGNKKKYINIFPIMKVLVICLLLSLVNKSNDNAYNKDIFQKDKGNCGGLRYKRLLAEPIFGFDVMYDLFKDNFLEQIGYNDAQKNELKVSMKSFFQSSNSQEYTYARREDNIHSISKANVTNVKSVKFEEPQDEKNLITIEEINADNNDSKEKKNEVTNINVDEKKDLERVISNEKKNEVTNINVDERKDLERVISNEKKKTTTSNNERKKKKTKRSRKNKDSKTSYDNIEVNSTSEEDNIEVNNTLKEDNIDVPELIDEKRELIKKESIYKNKLKEDNIDVPELIDENRELIKKESIYKNKLKENNIDIPELIDENRELIKKESIYKNKLKEDNIDVQELIDENRELIKKESIYKNKLKEEPVEKRIKRKNYIFLILEKAKEIPPGVIVGLFSIFYVALGENRSSLILLIVIFILTVHTYLEVKRICRFLNID